MSIRDLLLVYAIAGVACAVAILRAGDRSARSLGSAALALVIWPLWAPIVLGARSPRPSPDASAPIEAVEASLREGIEACAGTALEPLLTREAGERIARDVRRASSRLAEIDALLAQPAFNRAAAEARIEELRASGASERAVATARHKLDNIARLAALRDADARALAELGELLQALKAQIALARFSGNTSISGASGIVQEVWARVEGLGAALDAQSSEGAA